MKPTYIFFTLLSFDLVSKFALNYFEPNSMTLVPGILDYILIKNTGIALSLLSSDSVALKSLLLIIIFFALLFLFNEYKKSVSNRKKIGFLFILSGGLGNFIERIFFGSVTDFLHLRFLDTSLFVFNLADLIITIGAIILIFEWILNTSEK